MIPEAVVPEVVDVSPRVTIPTPIPTPTPTPIPVADPTPAPTKSQELIEFTNLLNDYRLANGVGRVILATELSDEARINNLGDTPHNYMGQSNVQNWASGYASPSAVLQAWIESPGHNANLLHPAVKSIGLSHDGPEWTFNGSFRDLLPVTIPPPAEPAVVTPVANPIDVDQQKETEQTEPSPTADNPDAGNVPPPPVVEPTADPGRHPEYLGPPVADPSAVPPTVEPLDSVPASNPPVEPETIEPETNEPTTTSEPEGLPTSGVTDPQGDDSELTPTLAPDSGNVLPPPAGENLQPTEQPSAPPANEQKETAATLMVPAVESRVNAPSHGVSSSPADRAIFGRSLRRLLLARGRNLQLASRITDNGNTVVPATVPTTPATTAADDSGASDTATLANDEEPIAAVLPIATIAFDQRPSTTEITSPSQPAPENRDQALTIEPTILRSEKFDYDSVPHDPPVVSVESPQPNPSVRVNEPPVIHTLTVFRGFRRLLLASNARLTVDRNNDKLTDVVADAPVSQTVKTADAVFATVGSRDLTPDESSPSDNLLDLLAADRPAGEHESPLFRRLGSTRALRSRAA